MRPPTAPPLRLPYPLTHAATTLDAPLWDWEGLDDFAEWMETPLTIPIACCTRINPATGRAHGWLCHRLGFDPHTGAALPASQTSAEAEKVAARHTLWALTHAPDDPPVCQRIAPTLTDWWGAGNPGPHAPWNRGPVHDRMLAVRTMLRGMAYLDVGLSLHTDRDPNVRWLAVGAPPEVVVATRRLLAGIDRSREEHRVLGRVAHTIGLGKHPLKPGQRPVTTTTMLRRTIAEFVGHTFQTSDEQIVDLVGSSRYDRDD